METTTATIHPAYITPGHGSNIAVSRHSIVPPGTPTMLTMAPSFGHPLLFSTTTPATARGPSTMAMAMVPTPHEDSNVSSITTTTSAMAPTTTNGKMKFPDRVITVPIKVPHLQSIYPHRWPKEKISEISTLLKQEEDWISTLHQVAQKLPIQYLMHPMPGSDKISDDCIGAWTGHRTVAWAFLRVLNMLKPAQSSNLLHVTSRPLLMTLGREVTHPQNYQLPAGFFEILQKAHETKCPYVPIMLCVISHKTYTDTGLTKQQHVHLLVFVDVSRNTLSIYAPQPGPNIEDVVSHVRKKLSESTSGRLVLQPDVALIETKSIDAPKRTGNCAGQSQAWCLLLLHVMFFNNQDPLQAAATLDIEIQRLKTKYIMAPRMLISAYVRVILDNLSVPVGRPSLIRDMTMNTCPLSTLTLPNGQPITWGTMRQLPFNAVTFDDETKSIIGTHDRTCKHTCAGGRSSETLSLIMHGNDINDELSSSFESTGTTPPPSGSTTTLNSPHVAILIDSPFDHSIVPKLILRPWSSRSAFHDGMTTGTTTTHGNAHELSSVDHFFATLNDRYSKESWSRDQDDVYFVLPNGHEVLYPGMLRTLPLSYLRETLNQPHSIGCIVRNKISKSLPTPSSTVRTPARIEDFMAEWESGVQTPWNKRTGAYLLTKRIVPHINPRVRLTALNSQIAKDAQRTLLMLGKLELRHAPIRRGLDTIAGSKPIVILKLHSADQYKQPLPEWWSYRPLLSLYAAILSSGIRHNNDEHIIVTSTASCERGLNEFSHVFANKPHPACSGKVPRNVPIFPPASIAPIWNMVMDIMFPTLTCKDDQTRSSSIIPHHLYDSNRMINDIWTTHWANGRVHFAGQTPISLIPKKSTNKHLHVCMDRDGLYPDSNPDFVILVPNT